VINLQLAASIQGRS